MSRIGKKPIVVVSGVKVNVNNSEVLIEGPKGKLKYSLPHRISVEVKDNQVWVQSPLQSRLDRSFHGLSRSLIANMIKGVSEGYGKELEIHGVGFKAALQGNSLILILGFSHPVTFSVPEGITIETYPGYR